MASVAPSVEQNWWSGILTGINAPLTQNNYDNLSAWSACEGGIGNNNPFNTTLPGGSSINSVGVQKYPSFQVGLSATIATLLQPNMSAIVNALRADVPRSQFAAAIGSAPWGTNPTCVASAKSSAGVASGGGSFATSPGNTTLTSTKNCAWSFSLPLIGSQCLFSEGWARAALGGMLLFAGGIVLATGLIILAANKMPPEVKQLAELGLIVK